MIFRRIKGALILSLLWAIAWAAAGVLIFTVQGGPFRGRGDLSDALMVMLVVGILWGVLGFLSGLIVSVVIALAERRRTVDQLSPLRIAVWGGLSAASLMVCMLAFTSSTPQFQGPQLILSLLYTGGCGVLGAGLAMAQLKVARRSLPGPRELERLMGEGPTIAKTAIGPL